eukprot:10869724-Alexandrium_andersonii.AAC.1
MDQTEAFRTSPGFGGVPWSIPEISEFRKCAFASGARSFGCAGPGTASKFVPEAPGGCILCRLLFSCRIHQRNEPAGAPEAFLRV